MSQNQLFNKIISWGNLLNAYTNAAKRKWFREDISRFSSKMSENLLNIQNKLMNGTYTVGEYRQFYITIPKRRLIMALGFEDRIVQWAIYLLINPIYENLFYYHSYACRKDKGKDRAIVTLQNWLRLSQRRKNNCCYLKLDISKYFYRINHEVLINLLNKRFPNEPKLVDLLSKIINCEHTAFGLPLGYEVDDVAMCDRLYDVGMPIGNLTSQLLANVCLHELDMFVKHDLKVKKYIRYMDDMVILGNNFEELNSYRTKIEAFLNKHLKLNLNSKTSIGLIKNGITFLGLRVHTTHLKLSKKSLNKLKSRLRYVAKAYRDGNMEYAKVQQTITSYYGLMSHCNALHLKEWIVHNIKFKDDIEENRLFLFELYRR